MLGAAMLLKTWFNSEAYLKNRKASKAATKGTNSLKQGFSLGSVWQTRMFLTLRQAMSAV